MILIFPAKISLNNSWSWNQQEVIKTTRLKIVCIVSTFWFNCKQFKTALTRKNNTRFLWDSVLKKNITPFTISWYLRHGGKWALLRLETLSLNMILRIFLIFCQFWDLGKKDSYKKETVHCLAEYSVCVSAEGRGRGHEYK